MNKKQGDIKHVAIYLRKSRDEGEYDDVLSKHRDTLLAIATAQNWTYRLYEEIGSGESIAKRNKMQQLLMHVDEGYYDGVLVMDIDRLGRGEHQIGLKSAKHFYILKPMSLHHKRYMIYLKNRMKCFLISKLYLPRWNTR
jgi:site-specific DNA recombinase